MHESQSKAWDWLRLAKRKHRRDLSSKVRWVTPYTSTVHRLVSSGMTRAGLMSHPSWSPVVSWKAGSCWERAQAFQRVILHGEAGLGMHSHSKEAGFTWLWWIQRMISATLTVVGVDKTTTKGLLQWDFSSWTFHSFTQTASSALFISVCVSCQANREVPSYPVIDFWESQSEGLHLLSQGEVTYFLMVPL
jgi:hypothetical protein